MAETEPLLRRSSSSLVSAERPLGPLDISKRTRYAILLGVWTGTFLSSINQTLVPTMIPVISSEFNRSHQASWLGTSYLLATCTFTPLYGRLCNALGRKGASLLALTFCAAGILLCGLSRNMETLIAARFLSGIGGGGLFTTSSIVISDMYSLRSRGLPQGFQSVFAALGMGLGGPVGGIITDWLGWRWAFILQLPLFLCAYFLVITNLNYVTEGKGKSTKEILRRIDYGGSITLMMAVGSCLFFLSARYNDDLAWSHPYVITPLALVAVCSVLFVVIELKVALEPVLAPHLLKQKIPVLVGMSNFCVAMCNFSIMYFFPMWFQTVLLTSASVAGLHLVPNCISMSLGSLFAGWMMHVSGRYKLLNLILGILPFAGAILIYRLQEDSSFFLSWFSIIPLGFGNAVVLQTMLIALLVHLPESDMAVGTGFGVLWRGVGQVGGVAVSSAIFQSRLDSQLRRRITGPNADEMIRKIRHNAKLVSTLPAGTRLAAQESYKASLKSVFFFAACMTLCAYIVRLPIPDKQLEHHPKRNRNDEEETASPEAASTPSSGGTSPPVLSSDIERRFTSVGPDADAKPLYPSYETPGRKRRLSTYDTADQVADPEIRYGTPRV